MELLDYLKALNEESGPSGFEAAVTETARSLLAPFADEISVDAMGNLIALRRCGRPGAKRLLLDAHLDEVGLIVTGAEEGFLRFSTIGGVDGRMLPGREVTLMSEPPRYGVICCPPTQALSEEKRENAAEIEEMFIDVGLTQEEAEKAIPVGTPGVFYSPILRLQGDAVCGRALDDRLCAAILIAVFEAVHDAEPDYDLYVMLSTQEEVGLRGAAVGAWTVDPDLCVTVDVTHAETPDEKSVHTFKAGKGCTIAVGPNASHGITQALRSTAEKHDIPYQIEVIPGHSGTNGWAIQLTRQGVATAILSVPLRYMHSPVETARLSDAEAAVRLLTEFVCGGAAS